MNKISRLSLMLSLFAALLPGGAQARKGRVLMVVTSAGRMADGTPTGIWLEEFAVPYLLFRQAGFEVAVASPAGGQAPLDPHSTGDAAQEAQWGDAIDRLANTVSLDQVAAADFDAVFLPGGHGTMFDLPGDARLRRLLGDFEAQDKPVAAVCHGPAGFVGVKKADGTPLVAGRTVTSFTDEEEAAVNLTQAMPFLLETRLREEGANFVPGPMWASHVQVDGRLVTGQNPASSKAAAEAVIDLLK